ncbi:Hypothetical protein NTJ_02201 [Nesidiocoris tenuis]|uniref:Uncharacterized protein n=1 Tax=Nesidiocoris tenuis TaxID=355587 RepID=A0ABN7AAP6_9HEMI|nr:Hypothetical protein NTJ_02201 [Nesidiocoris tenuis]
MARQEGYECVCKAKADREKGSVEYKDSCEKATKEAKMDQLSPASLASFPLSPSSHVACSRGLHSERFSMCFCPLKHSSPPPLSLCTSRSPMFGSSFLPVFRVVAEAATVHTHSIIQDAFYVSIQQRSGQPECTLHASVKLRSYYPILEG